MAISLSKGQKINLTKENPNIQKVTVGLGWNTDNISGSCDLDASVFMLGANGKVTSDYDIIFYNNRVHSSQSVEHMGDSLSGGSGGDDEVIRVDLSKVPDNIQKIAFTVTIYDADARRQTFGAVQNAYIRIIDEDMGAELLRYDLREDFSVETALVVGELYRHNGEWKFSATGSGFAGGLGALCKNYGVNV